MYFHCPNAGSVFDTFSIFFRRKGPNIVMTFRKKNTALKECLLDLTIERADATLGVTDHRADLANLDKMAWRTIEDAFHEHAVSSLEYEYDYHFLF
jgi:hypothetical protein